MNRLAVILSTGFGLGYFPLAPGTAASLVTLPVGYVLALYCGMLTVLIAGIITFAIGVWAAGRHAAAIGEPDPGTSVIDEIAGQLVAMSAITLQGNSRDILAIALAFGLFRFFDIVKPWPISRLERFPGGLGIMSDDLAAGALSALLLLAAAAGNWI